MSALAPTLEAYFTERLIGQRHASPHTVAAYRVLLAELGLEPKAAKTRIVELAVGGEGLDFLGFHHRLVRSDGRQTGRHVIFLARWPTSRAMQRARDRLRELTDRSRLQLPIKELVDDMNRFLRGWSAYFRFGNSTLLFEKLISFAPDASGDRGLWSPPAQPSLGSLGRVLSIAEPLRADHHC